MSTWSAGSYPSRITSSPEDASMKKLTWAFPSSAAALAALAFLANPKPAAPPTPPPPLPVAQAAPVTTVHAPTDGPLAFEGVLGSSYVVTGSSEVHAFL